MKKYFLPVLLAWPFLTAAQDLPRYDAPQPSANDPDVWQVTRPRIGRRFIEVSYTPLPDLIAANAQAAEQQHLPPADRREKLHRDSATYAGGLVFIAATCPNRTAIDGALAVVVFDEQRHEVLRRTLYCTEAELSINSESFGRVYAVPIGRALPPNALVRVEDVPAHENHEFVLRPVAK